MREGEKQKRMVKERLRKRQRRYTGIEREKRKRGEGEARSIKGREEAQKRKEKVIEYTKPQENTQVEGREEIFQESMFVKIGKKQGNDSILKDKEPQKLICGMCTCNPQGIPQGNICGQEMPIS